MTLKKPMKSENQEPVTKELWYNGQKAQADAIKAVQKGIDDLAPVIVSIHKHLSSQDLILNGIDDKVELKILEQAKSERNQSDKQYAIKLVERILFGILALFGAGTVAYLVSLIFHTK